jgi:hypothetical protein
MNRTLLGICALALLVMGAIALRAGPSGITSTSFAAGCLRVGLVLGALWLALPQIEGLLKRTPRWVLVSLAVALVILFLQPKLLLLALPILAVLWSSGWVWSLLKRPSDGRLPGGGARGGRRRFKRRPE